MQSLQLKQILFLIFIVIALIIIFGVLIYTSTVSAEELMDPAWAKKKLIHYQHDDVTIDEDEVIEADIVLEFGEISLAGEVYGDIIALNSDVILESTAKIYGHVVCYDGDVETDEDARIAGDIIIVDDSNIDVVGGRNLIGYGFQLNQYQNNLVVGEDETITGDVLILNHELTINGKIDGDVINILGRTIIKPTAAVDGHVIAFKGQIATTNTPLVTGRILGLGEETRTDKRDKLRERDEQIRKKIERKYLRRNRERDTDVFRFWGDVTIEQDELIRGAVVTVRGTINVQGEVDGDVVAVFGGVDLDSTAYVHGDVVSVGGKIYRERGSFVGGDIVQTTITGVKVDDGDQHVSVGVTGISVGPKKGDEWERKVKRRKRRGYYVEEESVMFRYNRVEGLFLGLRLNRGDWGDPDEAWFDVYGHAGYGFSGERACYQLGIERSILGKYGPIIGIEAHDVTETQDTWIMPTFENSLAAILIREDFHDFYGKEGYSAYLSHNVSEYLKITAEYRKDEFYNLKRETNKSIFGGDKRFRDNPKFDEKQWDYKSLVGNITLDTRDSYKYPNKGWLISLTGEFARENLNNNGVDFDRFVFDIRRYQPLSYGENLDFRLRAGSSRGILPAQLLFDLGGFSSLRGYKFKEFQDKNRMILGNIEYRIYGKRNPLNSLFGSSDFNLILFADAGYLWSNPDTSNLKADEGFDNIDWGDLKTSIGFAISNEEGNVRLSFAKRLDEKDQPIVVTFRINRPF